MMKVIIKRLEEDDYLLVNDIVKEGQEEASDLMPNRYKKVNFPLTLEAFHDLIKSKDRFMFVAHLNQFIVGYVIIESKTTKETHLERSTSYAYIRDIRVLKAYQNQGIGKELIQFCQNWAKIRQLDTIELNVSEQNEQALNFYQSVNMKTASRNLILQLV
jgi:diamine N-acetyltransferase